MKKNRDMYFSSGSACNKGKVGETNTLFGDPKIRIEKPYTIICFPGADVEISRCTDGRYWVHLAVRYEQSLGCKRGAIVDARIDHDDGHNYAASEAVLEAMKSGGVNHIAFLVEPPGLITQQSDLDEGDTSSEMDNNASRPGQMDMFDPAASPEDRER